MKRKVLIITLGLLSPLIAYGLILLFEDTVIRIEVNSQTKMSFYKDVYTDVQNDDYKMLHERQFGRGTSWVKERLMDNLTAMDFVWHGSIDNVSSYIPNPKDTDMIVTCHLTYGWGIPEAMGHYGVEARFIKTIIIEFLDAKSKTLIARISYRRGFADSSDGDIDRIFAALKEKLKERGSWSVVTGVSP